MGLSSVGTYAAVQKTYVRQVCIFRSEFMEIWKALKGIKREDQLVSGKLAM